MHKLASVLIVIGAALAAAITIPVTTAANARIQQDFTQGALAIVGFHLRAK